MTRKNGWRISRRLDHRSLYNDIDSVGLRAFPFKIAERMDAMLWLSIVVLLTVAGTPLIAAVIFGNFRVCDADSHAECIRNWLSAMAGPLAIVAAFIAAMPVYEQLDEGRQATRAALAGLFKYEEDEKGGEMSALNEESEKVVKNIAEILKYISTTSKSISENKDVKSMIIDIGASKICINTSKDLG